MLMWLRQPQNNRFLNVDESSSKCNAHSESEQMQRNCIRQTFVFQMATLSSHSTLSAKSLRRTANCPSARTVAATAISEQRRQC
jgi:hypothetical protein